MKTMLKIAMIAAALGSMLVADIPILPVQLVSDALDVDDDAVRLLVEHAAAQECDHPAGGRYRRQDFGSDL